MFKLKKYVPDRRLCVYSYAVHYLHRTLELRGSIKSFFITCVKPHKIPSRDTYYRWVKTVLAEAGIDIQIFGAGSTRSAAASKAVFQKCPLQEIMGKAGWTRESTFSKWYKKSIVKNCDMSEFVLK